MSYLIPSTEARIPGYAGWFEVFVVILMFLTGAGTDDMFSFIDDEFCVGDV
jgi:hypothetical protein